MDHSGKEALAQQLATWILRQGGAPEVAVWTHCLVEQRGQGHSCVMLADHAGLRGEDGAEFPSIEDSRAILSASSLVGDGSEPSPLVLADDRLALYRDHIAEQRLARAFSNRVSQLLDRPVTPGVRAMFDALYPDATATGAPLAAAVAFLSRLCVLTGGPGTGKTTAVVRMLALLLAADNDLGIALAAPTGKAATRLQESIHGQVAELPVSAEIRERLLLPVSTVHRLLGIVPGRERIRHDVDHPLPADVVVVDEASMVDLQLMDLLVAAVKPDARLVLVGDRDQLASVDAGAVLADLVSARRSTDDGRTKRFADAATGFGLTAEVCEEDRPLADALVELRVNYRFESRPGIATVATALRDGDAERVLATLADEDHTDVRRMDLGDQAFIAVIDPLLDELPDPSELDPARWLDVLEHRLRVLGATHGGIAGVSALNDLVESRLRHRGWRTDELWYAGRPILIERNHHGLGLSNGDLGVSLPDPEDPERMLFHVRAAAGEEPRALAVEQLPAHRTAWAMTLHKSQGSEFDHVLITLPSGGHPLLSRELLYTGVTRAREQVTVFADEATIREAVHAVQQRRTGLADALRRAGD